MPKDFVRYPPFDEEKVMREVLREGIMRKRNVTVAFVGTKKVGGKDTGEPCVVVGVHDKMDVGLLSKKDIIPKRLRRSRVKTDVIVKAKVRPLAYTDPWPYWRDLPDYEQIRYTREVEYGDPNCAGERLFGIREEYGSSYRWQYGCPEHAWIHRPVVGGISMGVWYYDYYSAGLGGDIYDTGGTGTLGTIVRDRIDNKLAVLTNNHVLAENVGGAYYDTDYLVPTWGTQEVRSTTQIIQPSWSDWYHWYQVLEQWEILSGGEPDDDWTSWRTWINQKVQDDIVIGNANRAHPIQFGPAGSNTVDAAIANINKDLAYPGIYKMHDGPYPFASKSEYEVGDEVYISSRTTGYRPPPVLYIQSKSAIANVAYSDAGGDENTATFTDQILIATEDEAGDVATGGDSGSAIVAYIGNVYKIVGLLFAGPTDRDTTYANHISNVASTLNIGWWDGNVTLETDAYGAMVDTTCYHKIKTVKRVPTHTPTATYGNCEECDNPIEISFTDSTGVEEIESVMHVPVKPGTSIDKEIYIWFDRDDPQDRFPTSDCPNGPYVITGVKLSVACKNDEYTGQTNLFGQECVDEKWIKVRSDGVRGYGCEEMIDDEQKTYKAIGGGFDNSADYLSLGNFVPDSARKIYVRIEIPEGIETVTEAYPKLVVQYAVENTSSSSQSSSSSLSSSSESSSSESSSFSSDSSSSPSSSSSLSSDSSLSAISKSSSSDSSSSYSQCGYWGGEFTIYTANCYSDLGLASNAVDNFNTTVSASSSPGWFRYYTGGAASQLRRCDRMRLYCYENEDRMPTSFTLVGSSSGVPNGGDTLLTVSGITWSQDEWKTWEVSNTDSYSYYYLYITEVQGGGSTAWVYNWEMYECLEHSYSSTSSSSQSSSSLSSESSSSSNESPSSSSSDSSSSESSSSESSSSESSSSLSSVSQSSSPSSSSSSESSESSSKSCDVYSDDLAYNHGVDHHESSQWSTYDASKLFDNNNTTQAIFDEYPSWGSEYWLVELDDLYWVGKLRLYMDANVGDSPKDVILQGSTSLAGPWDNIITLTNLSFTAGVWKEFSLNPDWPYWNFRLLVLDGNGTRWCRLYSMELLGCCANSCSSSSSSSQSVSTSSSSSESVSSSSSSSQSSSSESSLSSSSESSVSSESSSSESSQSSSSESSSSESSISSSSYSSLSSESSSSTSSLSSSSDSSSSESSSSDSSSESKSYSSSSSESSDSSESSSSSSSATSKSSSSDSSQSSDSSSSTSSLSSSSTSSQSSDSSYSSSSSSSESSQSSESSSSTSSLSSSSESSSSDSSLSSSSESSESSLSSSSESSLSSSSDSSSESKSSSSSYSSSESVSSSASSTDYTSMWTDDCSGTFSDNWEDKTHISSSGSASYQSGELEVEDDYTGGNTVYGSNALSKEDHLATGLWEFKFRVEPHASQFYDTEEGCTGFGIVHDTPTYGSSYYKPESGSGTNSHILFNIGATDGNTDLVKLTARYDGSVTTLARDDSFDVQSSHNVVIRVDFDNDWGELYIDGNQIGSKTSFDSGLVADAYPNGLFKVNCHHHNRYTNTFTRWDDFEFKQEGGSVSSSSSSSSSESIP